MTKENFMIIEVENAVIDECHECGCKKFLDCVMTLSSEKDGSRKHVNGLKCYDCGIIYYIKK
jgi:hypothetical protein